MKTLDIIAVGIVLGAFVVMVFTLINSAFHGYVISVATNNYGEAIAEIIAVSIATVFVFWRGLKYIRK